MKYEISPYYRPAIFVSLPQQAVAILLSMLILDGGQTAQICGMAFLAFWVGIGLIMLRRPLTPTQIDLLFIRFGFIPLFIVAFFIVPFVWQVRGVQVN